MYALKSKLVLGILINHANLNASRYTMELIQLCDGYVKKIYI